MNSPPSLQAFRQAALRDLVRLLVGAASLCAVLILWGVSRPSTAAPGAHGPNGEHLDAPGAVPVLPQRPRVVMQSDAFELVAELHDAELVIFIDRYATNEPVLKAQLEVETGSLKATAVFQENVGAFAVTEPKMLGALRQPGEHALVFTVVTDDESDLLDGVLIQPGAGQAGHHDHLHLWEIALGAAGVAAGGLLVWWLVWRMSRRRQAPARAPGGSSGLMSVSVLMPVAFALAGALTGTVPAPAQAAPGAHGPNGEHLDAPAGPVTANSLARLPDGSVNVPKLAQRRMALRTVLATESPAAVTVELPGRVIVDPNAGGRVQAAHGGRLEPGPQGLPVAGQRVRRGDVLAYVRHHAEPYAIGAQQAQLADLQAQRKLAQARAHRLESLEGTVPRKDIEAAREEAASLVEREARIAQSLSAREALVSPVDGVIARADAVLGQVVEPRDVVFEVVDPARLWVEATTADARLITDLAEASLQGVQDVRLSLKGAARVLRDGVLPLTFAVRAAPGGPTPAALPLAIGQPVTVLAQTRQRVKGIVLPAQAVVRSPANEPIVWIKSGAERFIPQPVQFRPLDARTVVITQGLSAENRVVVQGAALVAQIR